MQQPTDADDQSGGMRHPLSVCTARICTVVLRFAAMLQFVTFFLITYNGKEESGPRVQDPVKLDS